MTTTYMLSESWGSDAHMIASHLPYAELPTHARAAIDAEPDADSWTVPALDGERLMDDLSLVIVPERS